MEPTKKCSQILIVEDDESIRETLRLFLELESYSVLTAENGKAALDRLSDFRQPGVILLDLMMPVMNGWEFLEHLHKLSLYSKTPVIVITAFIEKSAQLNVSEIIRKPLKLDQLLCSIKHHCGESQEAQSK